MKYLVVYDSVFGNTEKIARAIGDELAKSGQGETLRVTEVNSALLSGLDLLVAGSPTRAFNALPDFKKGLKGLPSSTLKGVQAAAFDTRMVIEEVNSAFLKFMAGIFGFAAQPIANILKSKGMKVTLPPEGFLVEGSEGPLKPGELERAAAWAADLLPRAD